MAKIKKPPLLETQAAKEYVEHAVSADLDARALKKETLGLHERRLVGTLENKKMSPKSLRKALAREQATRSRVLSIFMDCRAAANALKAMRDATTMRLAGQNPGLFPSSTKTDQKAYAAYVFGKATGGVLEDIEEARDTAEFVLQDIDKAAWNLKALLSTFELATRPEMSALD